MQDREALAACPDLSGIAFDSFGYQNYRECRCRESQALYAEFRQQHADMLDTVWPQ